MSKFSKFSVTLAAVLLTAGTLWAQSQPVRPRPANEVFTERTSAQLNNRDHPWTQWYTSNRFQLLYHSSEASITEANARTALNNLEEIFDVYVYDNGFRHPYPNGNGYKMCVYVLRPGEGHAFGGVTGNPGGPGMWLSSGAVNDWWALAHEFMHGLQIQAGGMAGGNTKTNFRGWFFESHANLMPHVGQPTTVHYCAEMYTRMPQAYLGSTRNRYCNWQFFEYVIHRNGVETVNKLWEAAASGANHDPFTELKEKATPKLSQRDLGDWFGDFAMKAVTWDINTWSEFGETTVNQSRHFNENYRNRGGTRHRGAYNGNSVNNRLRRARYTYLEGLDTANNRYVVPFAAAPQRYAYNIVRLYPTGAGTVTVKFRGDVQTANNIPNWTSSRTLYPNTSDMPNNPGSDWRYGLVAVSGDATGTAAATPTYSPLRRAMGENGQLEQPDVSIQVQANQQLYLVVAATPTVHHKIIWDQFYEAIYRFPYMVEITGAKPEGFQHPAVETARRHGNGGGYVAANATVAATAYVGPFARVTGGRVEGNARIEDRAIVNGGTVSGSAIVRGHAYVNGGTISGNAIVEENAHIWGGTITDRAKVRGIAHVMISGSGRVAGDAEIKDAPWIENVALNLSGTAKLYGDGEVYGVTATSGCYTGIVDNGTVGNNNLGGNLTNFPAEVTKPRSMQWYGESTTGIAAASAPLRAREFKFDNRGMLRYNLGDAQSATLKVFDSRGRVLRTMTLSGSRTYVQIKVPAAQMLFWKVETNGKVLGSGRMTSL